LASPAPFPRPENASEDVSGRDNSESSSPTLKDDASGEEDSEDEGPGDFDEDAPPDYLPRFWWAFLLFYALSNTNKSQRLSLFDPTPPKVKGIGRRKLKHLQFKGSETARANGDTGKLAGARGVSESEKDTNVKRARIADNIHLTMRRLEDELLTLQAQNQGIKTQCDICKTQLESEYLLEKTKLKLQKK
jgi:hypothetical protein